MNRTTYKSVISTGRTDEGVLWPIPIALDISELFASRITAGGCIQLRDIYSNPVALMRVEDIYTPDRKLEASLYGAGNDTAHPSVRYLLKESGPIYVGGPIFDFRGIKHRDFEYLRHSPADLRREIYLRGNPRLIAFQTRNPLHMAHVSLILHALETTNATILLHPVVGVTRAEDVPHDVRVRCYLAVLEEESLKPYRDRIILSLLPLAMRFGGPREALLHMIVRKNFGATDIIIGRDHAGVKRSNGTDFYSPYAAVDMAEAHQDEIGIRVMRLPEHVYVPGRGYVPATTVRSPTVSHSLSGTEVRRLLEAGDSIPEWFTDRAVARELHAAYPPLDKRGLVILIVGLSGSGKTTVATAVKEALESAPFKRRVSLVDGDAMRRIISTELGFTATDRMAHLDRMAFVATQVATHGGIAVVSTIAPFREARRRFADSVRFQARANFLLVHVNTTLAECGERDTKGLYAEAAAGTLNTLSGVGAPYEPVTEPEADVVVYGIGGPQHIAAQRDRVIRALKSRGYLNSGIPWKEAAVEQYSAEEVGEIGPRDYRVHITVNGSRVADPNSDIPMSSEDGLVTMVVEIPQYTRAKFECHSDGAIRQDVNADGSLRFHRHPDTIGANYGFVPQTIQGDGDPLDVVEVSGDVLRTGQVVNVKIIGVIPLVDGRDTDYKLIAIRKSSALFANVNDLEDLEKIRPSILKRLRSWLQEYKLYEGNDRNLINDEHHSGPDSAVRYLHDCHRKWLENADSLREEL